MKITYTHPVGGHPAGHVADVDESSGRWLIEHGYAEATGTEPDAEAAPRKRGRPAKTNGDAE